MENLTLGTVAAGAVLYYLDQTYHQQISHITFVALNRNVTLARSFYSTIWNYLARLTMRTPFGYEKTRQWVSFAALLVAFPLKMYVHKRPFERCVALF